MGAPERGRRPARTSRSGNEMFPEEEEAEEEEGVGRGGGKRQSGRRGGGAGPCGPGLQGAPMLESRH